MGVQTTILLGATLITSILQLAIVPAIAQVSNLEADLHQTPLKPGDASHEQNHGSEGLTVLNSLDTVSPQATLANLPIIAEAGEIQSAQYGDYVVPASPVPPNPENSQNVEGVSSVVKDVQIRFVNDKGSAVDEKGQPISGRTRKDFILGELRLKPGQVFRQDLLETDLQKLRRLEPFDQVNVSLESDPTGVSILYDIKEARSSNYTLGVGNSGDVGLNVRAGYRDANIRGLNDQLGGSVQFSGKDVQFNTQFISPYRRFQPNRLGYSIRAFRKRDFSETFTDDIPLANGDSTREGRFGGGVAVLRSFNDWDTALGLNYTRISTRDGDFNLAQVDRLGNPLSLSGAGIDDLVTVSFAVTRDRRDRRSNPTQGSLLTLGTEQAIPIGLGNVSRNRVQANYIQYVPVRWIGKGNSTENSETPEMLAFNLQAGTTIGEFPPAEAFNLGGLNSVRGYGSGKVASGRSYTLASLEYRFPIFRSVGGVIFTDFGSDLGSAETVVGEPGVQRDKPGTGFGYGVGLRVRSPIGLIRGDLGISIQGDIRFELTMGQRF